MPNKKHQESPDQYFKKIIDQAKKDGYLTYEFLDEVLPSSIVTTAEIEKVLEKISRLGIKIFENKEDAQDETSSGLADAFSFLEYQNFSKDKSMSNTLLYEKLYLNIPFEKRDWAKNEGLKFDGEGKCWYLPSGQDAFPFQDYWAYLENTYDDREELKERGCRYNRNLKKIYVPDDLDFEDFVKWWPSSLDPYVFDNRYVVHEILDQTGQADVYRAWDVKKNEYFAIKYFLSSVAGLTTGTQRKSFSMEMKALMQLDEHPNILELVTWGQKKEKNSDRFFIVSPWQDLGTLKQWIGKDDEELAKLTIENFRNSGISISKDKEKEFIEAALNDQEEEDIWQDNEAILYGILDGLAHAHSMGIYHRDVKPGNILLNSDFNEKNPTHSVVLCDFGASKAVDLLNPEDLIKNKHTLVEMRTVPYRPEFSPTSKEGQKELKNQNTWDLYAWAIIAIELLANKFVDNLDEALDLLENQISKDLDKSIVDLIKIALEVDPDKRPKNIQIFTRDLKKLTKTHRTN